MRQVHLGRLRDCRIFVNDDGHSRGFGEADRGMGLLAICLGLAVPLLVRLALLRDDPGFVFAI